MKIAGIVKTSCIDFPGRLSIALFTPGCNYDCGYCQNRHLLGKPYPLLDEDEVKDFLCKRAGLLDGVAVSGGEPTMQEGLCDFLAYAKGLGYETKLDTNGSRPDAIQAILQHNLADYIAVDYKAPWDAYESVCGREADPTAVKETFNLLLASNTEWEARTTVFPGLTRDDLQRMAVEAPTLPRYYLQHCREPFSTDTGQKNDPVKAYSEAELTAIALSLRAVQPNIRVRGAMDMAKSVV